MVYASIQMKCFVYYNTDLHKTQMENWGVGKGLKNDQRGCMKTER